MLIRKVEENISLFLFLTSWASIDLVPSKEFLFLKSISKNNHKSIFPDQIKSPSVFSTAIKAAIRCCLVERGESIDHPEDNVRRIFSWFQHFLCRQSLILNIIWENIGTERLENVIINYLIVHVDTQLWRVVRESHGVSSFLTDHRLW